MSGREGRRAAELRCAAAVAELDIPVPFDVQTFCASLGQRLGRVIRLVPVTLPAGSPSGLWCRTADADYLYAEEQTSPYHHACIVLHLVAHLVLGRSDQIQADPRLVPSLSPELTGLVLGGARGETVSDQEAEMFAFLVLERARTEANRAVLRARRLHRKLRPLWIALRGAVPDAVLASGGGRAPWRLRLHRRVVGIRDAELALRPYQDPAVKRSAAEDARAGGLAGGDFAATVHTAVLAAALTAHRTGQPTRGAAVAASEKTMPLAVDLGEEARWLAKVARAFTESPIAAAPARGGEGGAGKGRRTVRRWGHMRSH